MAILNDIVTSLKTELENVSGAPYNYIYSNVNERKPSLKTFPHVVIEANEESSIGTPEQIVVNSYHVVVDVKFLCTIDDTVSDVRLYLNNVSDDIKRFMEDEHDNLNSQGMILANYVNGSYTYTNKPKLPAIAELNFIVQYRAKRTAPNEIQ